MSNSPYAVRREAAHRRRADPAALPGAAPGEVGPVPGVGHDPSAGPGLVAPGERGALEAAAGGVLPLGLGGQGGVRPSRVRLRVLVRHVHHRVIGAPLDRAARPLRCSPAGAGCPGPPLAEVTQVDRAFGRGEHHRPGLEVLRRRAGVVGRVHRPFGDRRPAGSRARTPRTARWSPDARRSRTRRPGPGAPAPPRGSASSEPIAKQPPDRLTSVACLRARVAIVQELGMPVLSFAIILRC